MLRSLTRPRALLFALGLACIAALAAWAVADGVVAALHRVLGVLGPWGPGAFVLGVALLAAVGVPRAPMTIVGSLAFGLWVGALLAWVAALLGGFLGFAAARALAPPSESGSGSPIPPLHRRLLPVRCATGLEPGWAVLIARISPVPFWLVNWAAGTMRIPWRSFALASALGLAPSAVAYSAAGHLGSSLIASGWFGWGVAAAVLTVAAGRRVLRTRARRGTLPAVRATQVAGGSAHSGIRPHL